MANELCEQLILVEPIGFCAVKPAAHLETRGIQHLVLHECSAIPNRIGFASLWTRPSPDCSPSSRRSFRRTRPIDRRSVFGVGDGLDLDLHRGIDEARDFHHRRSGARVVEKRAGEAVDRKRFQAHLGPLPREIRLNAVPRRPRGKREAPNRRTGLNRRGRWRPGRCPRTACGRPSGRRRTPRACRPRARSSSCPGPSP